MVGIIGVEDIRAGGLVIPALGLPIPPLGLLIPPLGSVIPAVAVRPAAATENSLPTSASSRTSRCGCRIFTTLPNEHSRGSSLPHFPIGMPPDGPFH